MALAIEGAQAIDQSRQRALVTAGGVGERRMHLAEQVARTRDAGGQVGERSPGQRVRSAIEPESPEERSAVGQGRARIGRVENVALEDLEGARVAAAMQLEHGGVPGEVAVKRGAAITALEPLLQASRAGLCVQRLEVDVGEVMNGVGVGRVLLKRALGESSRLLEAVDLVIGEAERHLIPP